MFLVQGWHMLKAQRSMRENTCTHTKDKVLKAYSSAWTHVHGHVHTNTHTDFNQSLSSSLFWKRDKTVGEANDLMGVNSGSWLYRSYMFINMFTNMQSKGTKWVRTYLEKFCTGEHWLQRSTSHPLHWIAAQLLTSVWPASSLSP